MTAKSAPYPPCTVTVSRLKYQDSVRCLRRVTRPRGRLSPSLKQPTGLFLYARSYCRAVRWHSDCAHDRVSLCEFIMTVIISLFYCTLTHYLSNFRISRQLSSTYRDSVIWTIFSTLITPANLPGLKSYAT